MKALHKSSDRGTSVVEMALVAPVFFLLIFAAIDFGWYFFVHHTIQSATREGTRLALVGRQLTVENEEGEEILLSRAESIIKTINDRAGVAIDTDDLMISIFPVSKENNYAEPEEWQEIVDPGEPDSYMRVRTRYTHKFMTPFVGKFFDEGKYTIMAQTLYRNEKF